MRYYSADYRGVHARCRLRKNDVFLVIPRNAFITLEMAKATPIGSKMEKAKLNLLSPKHSFLSSFVLQERRIKDTKWEPYLDILPKCTNNFPIFFTPEEKKWLEGSPFLDQVEEKISDVKKDYHTIVTAVPEFSQFSFEEFAQVRMLISSRIFGICINGLKTDALVPLAGIKI
jgi:histone-lysine N-methyltransferase SETD3